MTSGKAKKPQTKPFLILGVIVLALLASPVLADYLGPNRTVSTWVWQRSTCNYLATIPGGSCTLTLYSPPHSCASPSSVAGYFGPGLSACGSSWPGTCGSGLACSISLTGDSVGGCSSGETGCTSTEQTSTYPPATVSGSVSCSGTVTNGWCAGSAQLVLSASEPIGGQSITLIEGTRNGVTFACPGASCSVPLSDGQNDFTFWALSTWGDSSTMGNASGKLDSQPPQVSLGGAGSFCPECGQSLNVTLSVSDAASGVSSWSLSLDGASITSGSGASSQTISIPAAGLSAGTHTLLLSATDVSGQSNSSSLPFTVLLPTPIPSATPVPNTNPASGGGQPAGPASGNASQPLLATPTAEETSTPAAEATPGRTEASVIPSQDENEPEGEIVTTSQDQPAGMTPEQTGNVLWGASATAAIAAATAYALAEQKKRKEEEARARVEAERLNNEARAHEKGYDSYADMLEAQAQAAFDAQWSQALADPKNHKMKQESVDPAFLAYLRTGKNPPPGYADMTEAERLALYKQTQQYQNYQACLVNWENENEHYQAWLHSGENPPPGMEDVTEAERLAMYQQTQEYKDYRASMVAWEAEHAAAKAESATIIEKVVDWISAPVTTVAQWTVEKGTQFMQFVSTSQGKKTVAGLAITAGVLTGCIIGAGKLNTQTPDLFTTQAVQTIYVEMTQTARASTLIPTISVSPTSTQSWSNIITYTTTSDLFYCTDVAAAYGLSMDEFYAANPDINCDVIILGVTTFYIPALDLSAIESPGITNTLNFTIPVDDQDWANKIKAQAFLYAIANPNGIYGDAWWFQDDGKISANEMLAIILSTEGSTNDRVKQAIAARYLVYCGGEHDGCDDINLLNVLSYYQPVLSHYKPGQDITDSYISDYYVNYGQKILDQTALDYEWAQDYIHSSGDLDTDKWDSVPYHYANVDDSWNKCLDAMFPNRDPDNPDTNLWIFTLAEAELFGNRYTVDNLTREYVVGSCPASIP